MLYLVLVFMTVVVKDILENRLEDAGENKINVEAFYFLEQSHNYIVYMCKLCEEYKVNLPLTSSHRRKLL
jgi:hypothetical protein